MDFSSTKKAAGTLPNVFYDIIAYFFSGILFLLIIALLTYSFDEIVIALEKNTITKNIFVILISVAFIYIWGQISSTFSSYFVKKPIKFIVKKILKRKQDDFFFKSDRLLNEFSVLQTYPDKKRGNYWTLLYFIFLLSPETGSDLMKRYARCKLARINSFNFFLISIYSILLYSFKWFQSNVSIIHILILLAIMIIMYIDYYQRQKWFNDIIIKVYASVHEFHDYQVNKSQKYDLKFNFDDQNK